MTTTAATAATTNTLRKIYAGGVKHVNLVYGGQGAGKTYALCQVVANECMHDRLECYVVGAEKTKLNERALRDMKRVLEPYIIRGGARLTNNKTFKLFNGSAITFLGLDRDEVGKSIRSDIVYFNELNEIKNFAAFDHFCSRARYCFADFNPSSTFFYDEIKEQYGKDVNEIKVTFRDNEYIAKEEKERIIKYRELGEHARVGSFNRYMYEVYYCGNFGALGGGVFENLFFIDKEAYDSIDAPETGAIDFGDVGDPNAIVGLKVQGNDTYIDEKFYRTNVADSVLAEAINACGFREVVFETATGGHTRVKNMRDLCGDCEFIPCRKKRVSESVFNLAQYNLYVCGPNAQNEFKKYKILDGQFNGADHLIDATRYGVNYIRNYA
jgi:PBSX family phage terminase large subunit